MKPMQASLAPADFLALKYPLAAEIKHDGVRCVALVNLGKVKLYSRSGKYFENFEEIYHQMEKMPDGVYDGEIVSETFDKLMTRANAERGKNTDIQVEYKIFDRLTIEEWAAGVSYRTYEERCIKENIGERTIIKNPVELEYYYNYVLKLGKEGLILKELLSIYTPGKSNLWLKLKPRDTIDLRIVGVDEGEGRHTGRLGAIAGVGEHDDYQVHAYVGTGFTDADREKLWKDKDLLVNKTMEVEYQEFTKPDRHGRMSLRFPVFKCLRIDK